MHPQSRANNSGRESSHLWVGYAQSMRAATISLGRFEPAMEEQKRWRWDVCWRHRCLHSRYQLPL